MLRLCETLWSADNDAVSRAEQVKVLKYSDLCDRAHLLFSPAGLDTFGGPGPMALNFLKTLFNTYSQHQSTDESQQARSILIAGCWEPRLWRFIYHALLRPCPLGPLEMKSIKERKHITTTNAISKKNITKKFVQKKGNKRKERYIM